VIFFVDSGTLRWYNSNHRERNAQQGDEMTRKNALVNMQIAGYHDDKKAFTRLLIENSVNRDAADDAFHLGAKMKAAGTKCGCHLCK
jgi:hypothetical protein